MPPATRDPGSLLRFGAFELDAGRGELRRNGAPVNLPPQPMKVLVSLVSHPGQLQTRDEIQNLLWKGETFVDFELGLNYCLNQIRKVLGDDARTPHYIQTVPRRGYRFIAPIQPVRQSPQTTAAAPSVAVLPFANLSAERSNAYFGDGLADEIITALTRVRGLRVTARTSSFAFRGQQRDVRQIGARLGVGTLLEGSVQRSDNRVRISAQLVSVADGFHLWSEHYDCGLTDVFAIQDEISRAIAGALALRLTPSRSLQPTSNLQAYNSWLKARHYQHYENLAALPKCRMCLDQAIALDPLFPQPYVSLADFFLVTAHFGLIPPREALAQGREAIKKAFELDDSLGELHALSGAYRAWMDFDWQAAAGYFDRALELTPAAERAHTLRATHYLVPTGRLREAEKEIEQSLELDPLSPLAYIDLVRVLVWERQFDRAQERMKTAFELWPDYALAKWFMGVALYFQGKLDEALALWCPAMNKIGSTPAMTGAIGMALGQLGHHAEARQVLAQMKAAAHHSYIPSLSLAQVHVGLGEPDTALELLESAVEERDPHLLDLPHKPIWDCLRSDPRFTALLRKMQLA